MRVVRLLRPSISLLILLCLPVPVAAEERQAQDVHRGKQMFETQCGICHSLDLPQSQRLNRSNWKWVIDDMVNKFGATWITEEQQKVILDYLVENYGPDKPRPR